MSDKLHEILKSAIRIKLPRNKIYKNIGRYARRGRRRTKLLSKTSNLVHRNTYNLNDIVGLFLGGMLAKK